MSGSPNMQDIALLRDALEAVNRERDNIERAERDMEQCSRRIGQAKEELRKAEEEFKRLMSAMDCQAPGNFGYENRLFALLTGLAKSAEQYGRMHP